MSGQPSEFSREWYRKQFQGVSHGFNRCWAAHQDCLKAVKSLRERTGVLEVELADARTEIGRQTDEIEELKESMKAAREVFRELRDANKSTGGS